MIALPHPGVIINALIDAALGLFLMYLLFNARNGR